MRDPKIELGKQMEQQRNEDFAKYKEKYPSEADEIENIEKGGLKEGWEEALEGIEFETGAGDATRKHSNKVRIVRWLACILLRRRNCAKV
jgi:transketolase